MSKAEELLAGKLAVNAAPAGAGGASRINPEYAGAGRGMVNPAQVVAPAPVAAQAAPTPESRTATGAINGAPYVNPTPLPIQAAGAAAHVDPAKQAPLHTPTAPAWYAGVGTADPRSGLELERIRSGTPVDAPVGHLPSLMAKDGTEGYFFNQQETAPTGAASAAPVAPKPQGTQFAGTAGRGSVNPPAAIAPSEAAQPEAAAATAAAAGAPSPAPAPAGTITIGGKTIQIPATGDLPAIPKVGATPGFIPGTGGGYAGGPIGGAPTGPVDSNGNGTTRTAELRAQLEAQRADQAALAERDQVSLAADKATADAADTKRAEWEQEVAASSILNRPSGTPAEMAAQTARMQIQNQAQIAKAHNRGMVRGQDIQARGQDVQAKIAERGQGVQARGQDLTAGVQTRGQDVQAQTAAAHNQALAQNAALAADTQIRVASGNNATAAANTKASVEGHMAVAKLQALAVSGQIANLRVDPLTHMATYSIGNKVFSEPVPQGAMEPKKAK